MPPSLILPAFSMARQKTLSLTHTCTHTHTHTHAHTHTHHRVLQQYGQQQSCRREQQRKRRRKICWWRRPRCRRGRLRSMHRPLTCRPKLLRFSPGCVCVRVRGRAPRYLETGAAVLHVLHVGRVQVVGVRQEGARWCCDALPSAGRNDVQVRRGWYAHISLSLYAGRWRKCSFRCQQCKRKRRSRAMWQRERKLPKCKRRWLRCRSTPRKCR